MFDNIVFQQPHLIKSHVYASECALEGPDRQSTWWWMTSRLHPKFRGERLRAPRRGVILSIHTQDSHPPASMLPAPPPPAA